MLSWHQKGLKDNYLDQSMKYFHKIMSCLLDIMYNILIFVYVIIYN
jgi:hypothetical protein